MVYRLVFECYKIKCVNSLLWMNYKFVINFSIFIKTNQLKKLGQHYIHCYDRKLRFCLVLWKPETTSVPQTPISYTNTCHTQICVSVLILLYNVYAGYRGSLRLLAALPPTMNSRRCWSKETLLSSLRGSVTIIIILYGN